MFKNAYFTGSQPKTLLKSPKSIFFIFDHLVALESQNFYSGVFLIVCQRFAENFMRIHKGSKKLEILSLHLRMPSHKWSASSWRSSSLCCYMRKSDEMTIGKAHPTLLSVSQITDSQITLLNYYNNCIIIRKIYNKLISG